MTHLSVYEGAALSETAGPGIGRGLISDVFSPALPVSKTFPFQSYFSDSLLQYAILKQPPNEPIVPSTMEEVQLTGYAIGLHPSSQTPVAIQFRINGQQGSSKPIILKPGQVVRPHGLPRNVTNGSFSGFRWGLPFGWLGGGFAALLVFQSPDADVSWMGSAEVIFHRQRMKILDGAAALGAATYNWPLRFPWPHAASGAGAAFPQSGQPAVSIGDPTRVLFSLRLSALAGVASMRASFQATNDFGLDSAGAPVPADMRAVDITWGSWASHGVAEAQYPVYEYTGPEIRMAADDGGVILSSLVAGLIGQYVDVVRYGRL